ncbi:MAG TPA: prepilin-type N-terminal cleavage/methylation domain-containing protein [Actinomycetes bacterium]
MNQEQVGHRQASGEGGRRPERQCGGFTLIELLAALMISTIALLALAGGLGAALKQAGLQKARTRGNEVATQAIEDLQRLDYDHLGVCVPASGAPSGLTAPAYLANCTSPTYSEPCTPTVGDVPSTFYVCTRLGIGYQIRRFIAWGDAAHTSKRLAVQVDWTDQAGTHQVTQQSSLRSPDQGSVVGLAAPAFTSTTVLVAGAPASSTNPVKLVSGVNQTPIIFQATTTGLPDSVFVSFLTNADTDSRAATLELTGDGAGGWSVTLPAGSSQFLFGSGTQYLTFVAVRSADGKVNSQPNGQLVTFVSCASGGTSCTAGSNPPGLGGVAVSPTSAKIDASGLLCSNLTVTAATTNLTASDAVTASFQTLSGPYTIALSSGDGRNWSGAIQASAGFRFAAGSQPVYVSAAQDYAPTATPPTYGSTAAAATGAVTFGGSCP